MASHNPEIFKLATRILKFVNEDSGPFSAMTKARRENEIAAALEILTEAAADSYEAAGLIADYFNEIIAVED